MVVGADPDEHLPDGPAGGVVAECADEFAMCADSGDILRNVRGATEGMGAFADANHGDRGFR